MKDTHRKHKRTRPRGWFSLFLAYCGLVPFLAFFAAVGFMMFAVENYATAMRFEQQAVEAVATVTSKEEMDQGSRPTFSRHHFLGLQYQADGRDIVQTVVVERQVFNRAEIGRTIPLRYLRNDPTQVSFDTGSFQGKGLSSLILSVAIGLAGIGWLTAAARRTVMAIRARQVGVRAIVPVKAVSVSEGSIFTRRKATLIWEAPDGTPGESLVYPASRLERIGRGAEINIYTHRGRSFWQGDVGPHATPDSTLPKVRRKSR